MQLYSFENGKYSQFQTLEASWDKSTAPGSCVKVIQLKDGSLITYSSGGAFSPCGALKLWQSDLNKLKIPDLV